MDKEIESLGTDEIIDDYKPGKGEIALAGSVAATLAAWGTFGIACLSGNENFRTVSFAIACGLSIMNSCGLVITGCWVLCKPDNDEYNVPAVAGYAWS